MQRNPVWCSCRRSRGELLQTKPIWRLPPRDLLSCGRNINLDSTSATSTAQPSSSLLNKSADLSYRNIEAVAPRREMRNCGETKVQEENENMSKDFLCKLKSSLIKTFFCIAANWLKDTVCLRGRTYKKNLSVKLSSILHLVLGLSFQSQWLMPSYLSVMVVPQSEFVYSNSKSSCGLDTPSLKARSRCCNVNTMWRDIETPT